MSRPRKRHPDPQPRKARPKARRSRSMGMDYLPPAQRTPPQPWHVATAQPEEPDMPLDPAELARRQVLHAAGERQQLVDPNDFVQTVLHDPAWRGRLQVDRASGLPTNADAMAAELADTSPHLVAGMGQRLRRAAHIEPSPPLMLPSEGQPPAPPSSADGGAGAGATDDRGPKPPDMNSILRGRNRS